VIVICRHGSTDGNAVGSFLSKSDPPLNALGRAQSERVRDELRAVAFDAAFVSPMRRCRETLAIVAPAIPCSVENALREIDFGAWEGRTIEWLEIHDPGGVAMRRRDPVRFQPEGGESFADVARRIRPFADALIDNGAAKTLLVVGHRGTLGVLERIVRGVALDARGVAGLEPGEYRTIG
jgi:broad specificity phosphatase PhoE